MNENKRILLLALGIMAMVASDPPVVSDFEQPRSVCSIAGNLAASAFESLIRSTLPLSNDRPEVERTTEILATPLVNSARRSHASVEMPPALVPNQAPAARFLSTGVEEPMASSGGIVQRACSGSTRGENVPPIEAGMQMRGKPLQTPS